MPGFFTFLCSCSRRDGTPRNSSSGGSPAACIAGELAERRKRENVLFSFGKASNTAVACFQYQI